MNQKYIIILIFIFIILTLYFYHLEKTIYKNIDDSILNLKNNYYNVDKLNNEKVVILSSHYNEDLFWLKKINLPFIIASKSDSNKTLYIPINKGNEASAYLTYIIKYYDYLPEFTLFLHGHYTHWHQFSSTVDKINNLTFDKQYTNINDVWFFCSKMANTIIFDFKNGIWDELFKEELGELPEKFSMRCCAQFLVHRDRIRLRRKQFYINILNYINNNDVLVDSKHGKIGFYLEYIWHYIFGENAVMNYEKNHDAIINKLFFIL